jgi:hypothetical protein
MFIDVFVSSTMIIPANPVLNCPSEKRIGMV